MSLPARPLTVSWSRRLRSRRWSRCAARPADRDAAVAAGDVIVSAPCGAVDDDGVGRPSPRCRRPAARSRLTWVTSVPVRSLTVTVSAPPRASKLICSTPLRSMVMLPTSRVNRTRLPLAERSMFSAMLAPLNSSVSVPSWPSTMSLPSPGFQTKVSLPAPRKRDVVAAAADDEVVAVAAEQHVGAVAAGDGVVAGAAVDRSGSIDAGRQRSGGDGVVAAAGR